MTSQFAHIAKKYINKGVYRLVKKVYCTSLKESLNQEIFFYKDNRTSPSGVVNYWPRLRVQVRIPESDMDAIVCSKLYIYTYVK